MKIDSLDDLAELRETAEVECKLAQGRDGKGAIPDTLWETYSAFVNTKGGFLILGVREKAGTFELAGIENHQKLIADLFTTLQNTQKVSANVIDNDDVEVTSVNGKNIVVIRVRQGTRKERPLYVSGNPNKSYHRLNDGDHLCTKEMVARMFAERIEDSRDDRILKGFGVEDLSESTVRSYRQALSDRTQNHPFLEKSGIEFLKSIKAWRRDREDGTEGLTVAGLLMFGKSESITDEFPHYVLDYQERAEPKSTARWVDRITTDGTWSGNLYDFYRLVYAKLTSGIKVPFVLIGGTRKEDTPVHVAIREALVNAIVHADYTGTASVLVVKRPDMFGFRNPGNMRVPVEVAVEGGESDCRNRNLQSMFLLVGAAERAGSGVPKIFQGWTEQHWRPPSLYESLGSSPQTLLELRMVDMLPPSVVASLRERFGESAFDLLSSEDRIILVTAAVEKTVSHSRAMSICDLHPVDLSRHLQSLVQKGFLVQSGRTRGATYHLSGTMLPEPDAPFSEGDLANIEEKGSDLMSKGSDLTSEGPNLSDETATEGRVIESLEYPLVVSLENLDQKTVDDLTIVASLIGDRKKVNKAYMRRVITSMCRARFIQIKVLAKLLNRSEDYLRIRYLNGMVEEGVLRRAFPHRPNDPRQAYTSSPARK